MKCQVCDLEKASKESKINGPTNCWSGECSCLAKHEHCYFISEEECAAAHGGWRFLFFKEKSKYLINHSSVIQGQLHQYDTSSVGCDLNIMRNRNFRSGW